MKVEKSEVRKVVLTEISEKMREFRNSVMGTKLERTWSTPKIKKHIFSTSALYLKTTGDSAYTCCIRENIGQVPGICSGASPTDSATR